ncbi:alpha/beta hydrolase [Vibrio sp. JC009]|uniref:alpha/beta fold hydrolase n=1 Tax=Vibrio sp. JC009 TaxID=2912314 RepID=UPI0023B01F96|nr:alpha/beta hydrolase [Vibrio sp. JC009]WED22558.1 alpha/beta hydrolase [Vibrio sp. JC009]
MFSEKRYQLENIRLASVELGEASAADTCILFLHGWLDNSASFFTVMQSLHAKLPGAHLVAADLPGHGLSGHRRADNYYVFHDYIDDLNQLVTKLSSNRLIIIGHSLGALVASCYSAAFPEKVDGLVQIEGFGPLCETTENAVSRLRKGALSRQRSRMKPERTFSDLDEMVQRRAELNQVSSEQIRPILERGTTQELGQWRWNHDSKLKCDSLYRMSPEHGSAILEAIECPHKVVLGDSGYAGLKDIAKQYQHLEISVEQIPGSHHCHIQNPDQISEIILGLVNKIKTTA